MEIREIPHLRDPIMVIAFSGWSDAGEASTGAITHLLAKVCSSEDSADAPSLIAEIDSEDFYDFQVNRPLINIDETHIRNITWPGLQVFGVHNSFGDRDYVLVRGVEPSMRWKTFAREILDIADDLEVNVVVTLGSMLADTPHSRAIPVTGTAAHPEIASRLNVEISKYEGPTGILGVIADGCIKRGIDAVSLWAAVPHYASAAPSPKAILSLINSLEDLFALSIPQEPLIELSKGWESAVSQLVEDDQELVEYVQGLENNYDVNEIPEDSGEELAREVERFLRRQNSEE